MEKRDWTEEEIVALCESYMPLVYSLIKRWNLQGNREEYIQIGRIALFEAWLRFDPDKGHFGAFAKSYVYGRMKQEIFKEDRWCTRHVAAEPVALVEMSPALVGDEEDVLLLVDLLDRSGLKEEERRWVEEVLFFQSKPKEIADKYGVSIHTVQSWRKNAARKLQVRLEE